MEKFDWIKMGLRILKGILLVGLVLLLSTTVSNKKVIRTEQFNFNKTFGVSAVALKNKEAKPNPPKPKETVLGKHTGDLTGYAADCPMCNGTLGCKPSYKVYKNGVLTYPDKQYGDVRIVASSKRLPCGSIIRFTFKGKAIYAIVLDRGVLGYDIDLLMNSEREAAVKVGRRKITYEVLRSGW